MDTKTTLEHWCHDVRKQIDKIIQQVNAAKEQQLPNDKGLREISVSYTKLQEAKMWLGKALEELGSELPRQYQDKAE